MTDSSSSSLPPPAPAMTEAATDVLHDRLIADEYKVWKKNSPYLYDLVMTTALDWPSLTVEWMPTVKGEGGNEHRLLMGTHTAEGEQNYLTVSSLKLPDSAAPVDAREYTEDKEEAGGFGGVKGGVEMKMKIKHEGEVHRARVCGQNPFVVATRGPGKEVSGQCCFCPLSFVLCLGDFGLARVCVLSLSSVVVSVAVFYRCLLSLSPVAVSGRCLLSLSSGRCRRRCCCRERFHFRTLPMPPP